MTGLARWLIPERVATSPLFRRSSFAASFLAFGISAALVLVARFFKYVPLEPLLFANWLLMIFVACAYSRIPPDAEGTDLKLRKRMVWVILTFTIAGWAAVSMKPGL